MVVGRSEPSPDVSVIKDLDFEREVLFEVLDDDHEVRQLDAEGLLRIRWGADVCGGNVTSADLKHGRVDDFVGDSLDVAIPH